MQQEWQHQTGSSTAGHAEGHASAAGRAGNVLFPPGAEGGLLGRT